VEEHGKNLSSLKAISHLFKVERLRELAALARQRERLYLAKRVRLLEAGKDFMAMEAQRNAEYEAERAQHWLAEAARVEQEQGT